MATGDKYEGDWQAGKKNGAGTQFLMQDYTTLQMETSTMASLRMAIGRASGPILGPIRAITKESGWVIK